MQGIKPTRVLIFKPVFLKIFFNRTYYRCSIIDVMKPVLREKLKNYPPNHATVRKVVLAFTAIKRARFYSRTDPRVEFAIWGRGSDRSLGISLGRSGEGRVLPNFTILTSHPLKKKKCF